MGNSQHTVYIGVGSNIGQKADNCRKAIEKLGATECCVLCARSPLYESEPAEMENQDWFVNGVVKIRTCLDPPQLLAQLQAIQLAMGRLPGEVRFGPRIMDLDILFFDERVLRTETLELPHPMLHQRRFVLQPLCDIAPGLVHPLLGKTVSDLLSNLDDGEKKVIVSR